MGPQASIGHYRITSKLGEGGMGAVYRTRDTKLNRGVAIKILPYAFAGDPDRLAWFEREAQVLASLIESEILLLKSDGPAQLPYSILPDGFLLYGVNDANTKIDLWILPLEGEPKQEPFQTTPFNDALGQFSPLTSGRRNWVAFTSDQSGAFEVYVESYPWGGGRYVVTEGGGTQAQWRPDGKELFYFRAEAC
jgi:serine/threonine protein kinase